MRRDRIHPIGCRCGCTPRSPADHAQIAIRARLIIAAIGAAVALLTCIIVQWRTP